MVIWSPNLLFGKIVSNEGSPASFLTSGDPPSKAKSLRPFTSVLPTAIVLVSGTFHFFRKASKSSLPNWILLLPVPLAS